VNEAFYFPAGSLTEAADASDLDAFRRGWYSRALHAMGEPSLSCGTSGPESYRFLWLRTWGRPVAVRFRADAAALDVVELDGAGGYDPGKVLRKASEHLGPADSAALRSALEAAAIWSMPPESTRMGLDGAQWILEARREGEYRVIDRWSPEPGPFRALCELLIRQAGVQLDSGANALY
jgi:hypothetical protein